MSQNSTRFFRVRLFTSFFGKVLSVSRDALYLVYLEISAGGREDEDGIAVDEFRENADGIGELGLIADILAG